MSFPKRLYPHLHEMYKLCGGDYNNSIEAKRYHHDHEKWLELELMRLRKIENVRDSVLGGNDGIHKISEDGHSEQR